MVQDQRPGVGVEDAVEGWALSGRRLDRSQPNKTQAEGIPKP